MKQRKICTLKNYLSLPESERGSPELLATVYNKMQRDKWRDELPKFSSSFIDIKPFADKMLTEQFSDAIAEGNDKIIKRLLPLVKSSDIPKATFVNQALQFALVAMSETTEPQTDVVSFDVCLRDLKTLLDAKICSLDPNVSLEKIIEDFAARLIKDGETVNLDSKNKLLQLVRSSEQQEPDSMTETETVVVPARPILRM